MLVEETLSDFWSTWVVVLTLGNILFIMWLVWWTKKIPAGDAKSEAETTGHEWDGLRELNNPLPRWWLYMFYLTFIFGFGYMYLWPMLGNYQGALTVEVDGEKAPWTAQREWAAEIEQADKQYAPVFTRLTKNEDGSWKDLKAVAADPDAHKVGQRLFTNYCSVCHGTTAMGATHFPNLTDSDWLFGGEPETIKETIMYGRGGIMPGFEGILSDDDISAVADHILSFSGRGEGAVDKAVDMAKDVAAAAMSVAGVSNDAGAEAFLTNCSGCHMPDGSGMQMLGAANLSDNTWVHGRSKTAIMHNIKKGFDGNWNRMPAFNEFLGEDKVHVLSAYIWSLSNKP